MMLKHEEDIRRRLTIAEVPEPPADLVHRIKHDIPKHFKSMTAKEVERKPREVSPLWNFWGMSWQLAAAILVLVGLTWAVFEAYRSEVNEASRVADAGSAVTTVDEFEKRVTDDSDLIHVEGAAPVTEATGRGAETESLEARPASPPAVAQTTARKRQREPVESEARDDRANEVAAARPEPAAPAAAAVSKTRAEPAAAMEDTVTTGLAARAAAPAPEPAAAAPVAAFAEESTEAKDATPREVVVRGLDTDRIIRVEVVLDRSGRVVETKLPDVRDAAVIDAVRDAAKQWRFVVESDDAGRRTAARTIEVQLRRGN